FFFVWTFVKFVKPIVKFVKRDGVSCRSKQNNDEPTSRPMASVNSDGTSVLFLRNVPTIVGLDKRSLFGTKKMTIELSLVSKCAE
ncbi:hypothetical protein T03_7845, partial [Trichinella britovi]